MENSIEQFTPSNPKDWRRWLEVNHKSKKAVWLIFYKKSSSQFNLSWSEAVDEALCFGWIDSVKKSIDSEKYKQYFAPRKANSTWSKINKTKVKNLEALGLMTESGRKIIEQAKKNGNWTLLDSVENLKIPDDLNQEFENNPEAKDYYLSLSKSLRKSMLHWIIMAKRPETRRKELLK